MLKHMVNIDEDYVIRMRRYFHQHPELSGEEYHTRDTIISELEKMAIPYVCVTETGIIGWINKDHDGPVVGLRADMDALPIEEENQCDYASAHVGVMHACGHDSHMAMLLGAAKALKATEQTLNCKVKLIFQPAEETMSGAKAMCQLGAMEDVDYLFGMHVGCDVDSGCIGLSAGPIMAAVDAFKITVHGKSAHGALPNLGVDAVVVGAQVVSNLQTIISREIAPFEPVVMTIGKFHGGTANNIIADEVVLEGTVRYFNHSLLPVIRSKMEDKSRLIAESYGASVTVDYTEGLPPVNNDEDMIDVAIAGAKNIGLEPVPFKPVTISEDYSILADGRKSAFGFIGIRQRDIQPKLHTHDFNIDETILAKGACMHVQFVLSISDG